jgi:hypothetical protein
VFVRGLVEMATDKRHRLNASRPSRRGSSAIHCTPRGDATEPAARR